MFIAVTQDGDAEVYNLVMRRFIAKVTHSAGPFRSVVQASFYDRASVALVIKRPYAGAHEPRIYIIKDFVIGTPSMYYQLRVVRSPGTVRINNSRASYSFSITHSIAHDYCFLYTRARYGRYSVSNLKDVSEFPPGGRSHQCQGKPDLCDQWDQ